MSGSYKRIIFLTGAPESPALDWAEGGLLPTTEHIYHLTRYLGGGGVFESDEEKEEGSSQDLPAWMKKPSLLQSAWRVLPLYPQHLSTGFSQGTPWQPSLSLPEAAPGSNGATAGLSSDTGTSFLTTSDLSFAAPAVNDHEAATPAKSGTASFGSSYDEILSQFYEHFLAVHQGIATSQIIPSQSTPLQSQATQCNGDQSHEDSGATVMSSDQFSSLHSPARKPDVGHICDVIHIPNAAYLESIVPQTMTVNLVVGIINIGDDRVVRTRRTGSEMHIVELLVGDETRAGFGINLWLPPQQISVPQRKRQLKAASEYDLAATLRSLHVQDIILARNAALSSFRGRVFGQSLRRGMTRLQLLHRRKPGEGTPHDGGGRKYGLYHPSELAPTSTPNNALTEKVRRVRDWLVNFVGDNRPTASPPPRQGPASHEQNKLVEAAPAGEILPPDTP